MASAVDAVFVARFDESLQASGWVVAPVGGVDGAALAVVNECTNERLGDQVGNDTVGDRCAVIERLAVAHDMEDDLDIDRCRYVSAEADALGPRREPEAALLGVKTHVYIPASSCHRSPPGGASRPTEYLHMALILQVLPEQRCQRVRRCHLWIEQLVYPTILSPASDALAHRRPERCTGSAIGT